MAAHRARVARRWIRVFVTSFAALATFGAGVSAYASWLSTGSGTGFGTTGTAAIQVQAVVGGNSTSLYPGGQADVLVKVVNLNAYSVKVTSITANGSVTAANSCTPTGVTFASPTDYSGAQFTLSASSTRTLVLANAASMSLASASACQGTTFSVPVTVQVRK